MLEKRPVGEIFAWDPLENSNKRVKNWEAGKLKIEKVETFAAQNRQFDQDKYKHWEI